VRVVIIGAGVGGLCLAQGLRQAGIDVRVCERDSAVDSRYQGFRIGIGGPGLDSLRECLPQRLHPLLEATTGDLNGSRRIVDPHLTEVGELDPMFGGLATDRRVLRHLLLGGLTTLVEFGKQLSHYTELADGTVRASFTDGTTLTADLLVGADGVNSAIRRQLLPHARLGDAGFGGVLGRTTLTERFAELVPGFGTIVKGGSASLMLGTMRFRRPPREAAAELAPDVDLPDTTSYLRWVLLQPPTTATTATTTTTHATGHAHAATGVPAQGEPLKTTLSEGTDTPGPKITSCPQEAVLEAIDGWHPLLVDLVRQADAVAALTNMRYAKDIPHWGTRPVTLLGDAVHVMPPSGGLGANTAFLDAATLVRELSRVDTPGDLLPAVERYEHAMLEHGFAAVHHSTVSLPTFIPKSA
jgi:2-polyprenyl-6-methoxyphenol hydroxylase-like FAD-dependent oxidoreductase